MYININTYIHVYLKAIDFYVLILYSALLWNFFSTSVVFNMQISWEPPKEYFPIEMLSFPPQHKVAGGGQGRRVLAPLCFSGQNPLIKTHTVSSSDHES